MACGDRLDGPGTVWLMAGEAEGQHHRDRPDDDVGDAPGDEAQAGEYVQGAGSPG